MDKSREKFEDHCRTVDLPLEIFNGNYNWNSTRLAWEGWQASRENLEIELPRRHDEDDEYDYFTIGYNSAIDKVYELLISNGVKIKND